MEKITVNSNTYNARSVTMPLVFKAGKLGSLVGGDDVPLLFGDLKINYNHSDVGASAIQVKRYADDFVSKKQIQTIYIPNGEIGTIVLENVFFDSLEVDSNYDINKASVGFVGFELTKEQEIESPLLDTPITTSEVYVAPPVDKYLLEEIDEGNGIGHRKKGADPANYGNIGLDAIDFSKQTSPSAVSGATGQESFTAGHNVEASAPHAVAMGWQTKAKGQDSVALNNNTEAIALNSMAVGASTKAQNNASFAAGMHNKGTDPNTILEIGIGSSDLDRKNGLEIYKNGTVNASEGNLQEKGVDIAAKYASISHNHDLVYAAKNHMHDDDYMPFTGGNLTGDLNMINGSGVHLGGMLPANKLDDYEEGTFTPVINGGSCTVNYAKYVKVGKIVNLSFYISGITVESTGSTFEIGGFPFVVADFGGTGYQAGSLGYCGSFNMLDWLPICQANGDYAYFHVSSGNAVRRTRLQAQGLDQLIMTYTYMIDF